MNTTPPRPVTPSPASAESADATLSRAPEATGVPAGASGSDDRSTIMSHPPTPEEFPSVSGYAIVQKIGEGGMGAVYLAEDAKLGRRVALKTMRAELAANKLDRDRFVREARAAANVEHDNIVPILHIGEAADGSPFIAMPLLQGEPLADRVKRQPVVHLGTLLKVAREVADGLAAAHAKGLIHRDIKPANVWLEGDLSAEEPARQLRRCKILDFGLARSVTAADTQITVSGAILGTPAYMAPEQARAEAVDHRADLYSLGVMLYRMATGKLPFTGPTAMAVLIAVTTDTPTPSRTLNPNLPPALAGLIDRLMSKDPAARPQSAADVSAAVRRIAKDVQAQQASSAAPAPAVQSVVLPDAVEVSSSHPRVLPVPADEETDADRRPVPRAVRPTDSKRSRLPLFAGIAAGLLALAALGWWLASTVLKVETPNGTLVVEIDDPEVEARIKNGKLVLVGADGKERYKLAPAERNKTIDAGPYTVHVEGADGLVLDTREFTLKKGDKVTVRVTLASKAVAKVDPPNKDAPIIEADRKAAEYALSIGGTIRINDEENDIKAVADLPKGALSLSWVDLNGNEQVTDAGLAEFKDCKQLTQLLLSGTKVTDAGLAHLKGCQALELLDVSETQVSDAGLAHLKACPSIIALELWGTQVSDAGLAHLKNRRNLVHLSLGGTKVTDVGLAHLKNCKAIMHLQLVDTGVTDAGLANFKDCMNLGVLFLKNTAVTDAGLAYFKNCQSLTQVGLEGTVVTDAGLAHLKNCNGLTHLFLSDVQVTDVGLAHFKNREELIYLDVQRTKATAKGIRELAKALPQCQIEWDGGVIEPQAANLDADRKAAEWVLSVGGSVHINGEGDQIKAAKALPKEPFRLTEIYLTAPVKDADLAAVAGCKNLTGAYLVGTGITNAGLAHVKDCKSLTSLNLSGTKVDDGSVPVIKQFTNLTDLSVGVTDISEKGVKEIAKALPGCRIQHNGGTVEPKPANLDIDRKAAEWVLSVGGAVWVNGEEPKITDPADLPKEPFRLFRADFGKAATVTDAGLVTLAASKNLTQLLFADVPITDAGVRHFAGNTNLTVLVLNKTKVTDAGLAHFKNCKNLAVLNLTKMELTDAGLAHFKDCQKLTALILEDVGVTDAGLAHFKNCKKMTSVSLYGGTVSDASVEFLKGCGQLVELFIDRTEITAKGAEELARAHPNGRVVWNNTGVKPKKK